MASTPWESTTAVQALLALISPLKYHAEYRPYFTIHDSEYQEFTGKEFQPPSCILGVTNPFFVKQLSMNQNKWPHILKLDNSSTLNQNGFSHSGVRSASGSNIVSPFGSIGAISGAITGHNQNGDKSANKIRILEKLSGNLDA